MASLYLGSRQAGRLWGRWTAVPAVKNLEMGTITPYSAFTLA
jgi:hypothetical protein